ncbi:hypothetical protein IWX50DRAFT_692344 [Phyllosticta citricarpa]
MALGPADGHASVIQGSSRRRRRPVGQEVERQSKKVESFSLLRRSVMHLSRSQPVACKANVVDKQSGLGGLGRATLDDVMSRADGCAPHSSGSRPLKDHQRRRGSPKRARGHTSDSCTAPSCLPGQTVCRCFARRRLGCSGKSWTAIHAVLLALPTECESLRHAVIQLQGGAAQVGGLESHAVVKTTHHRDRRCAPHLLRLSSVIDHSRHLGIDKTFDMSYDCGRPRQAKHVHTRNILCGSRFVPLGQLSAATCVVIRATRFTSGSLRYCNHKTSPSAVVVSTMPILSSSGSTLEQAFFGNVAWQHTHASCRA